MTKQFFCKMCNKFSGTRQMVREHLKDEHAMNRLTRKMGTKIRDNFYSIDENGVRQDYTVVIKKKVLGG